MDDSDLIWDWIQEERKRKRKRKKLKQCSKCGEWRSRKEFYRNARHKDGLTSQCKTCKRAQDKAHREANLEKYRVREKAYDTSHRKEKRARNKAYYRKNREKLCACKRTYRRKNPEKIRARNKAYRKKNPKKVRACVNAYSERNREKLRVYAKAYYERNSERISARNKTRRRKNPEKIRAHERTYRRKNPEKIRAHEKVYRETNIKMRLSRAVGNYMRYSLKSGKQGAHWESLVPYTLSDLIAWLESHWEEGMDWSNFGSGEKGKQRNPSEYWVIDHKRPISSFNFESPDNPEFQECWSLENLRPCWAKENMEKGAKWPYNPPARNKDDEDAKEAS